MPASVIIVSGPSGAGKGTIVAAARTLVASPVRLAVSATTRAARPGEVDGEDYFFLSSAAFELLLEEGGLVEHTRFAGGSYGTLEGQIAAPLGAGESVIVECEAEGARAIRDRFPSVSVFIAPPSLRALETRLRGRATETEETLARRLAAAEDQMATAAEYDHLIVNDDPDAAASALAALITATTLGPLMEVR
ncbi:guanylate kinase [Miltoncostaea oceani]|uniref:guanylate kinase n=1 Tax=Miltoncostaea oceani TaxID=2843216 RepID=UPI001C3C9FFA|nr:guanylate kinase [Miltoncostaea oceani]